RGGPGASGRGRGASSSRRPVRRAPAHGYPIARRMMARWPGSGCARSDTMLGDHLVFPILLARDLARSRAFYEGSLGLEVIREDLPDRFVLRCGAGSQLVITHSTTGTSDSQTQLAWRVQDLRAE